MKITKPLPPHELCLAVPAETMEVLKLYQHYQQDLEHVTWELEEMTLAIVTTFLAEGDLRFLAWRTRQTSSTGHDGESPGVGTEEGHD